MFDFKAQLVNLTRSLSIITVNTDRAEKLWRCAIGHTRQSGIIMMLANFETAAGHLAYLWQHKYKDGEFPDLPSKVDFTALFPFVPHRTCV